MKTHSNAARKKPAAKKTTATPRLKKSLIDPHLPGPYSSRHDATTDESTVSEDSKTQIATVPTKHAITTMTRPIKLKLRPRSEDDPAKAHEHPSPSEKMVKDTEEADGVCNSSTPKAGPSEKAEENSLATETIIDWRREPSAHPGGEHATRLGSGGKHGAYSQNHHFTYMAGPGRETLPRQESRHPEVQRPALERPTVSWVLKCPNPTPLGESPFQHDEPKQDSKGKEHDIAEPVRHATRGTPDAAMNRPIPYVSTQINSEHPTSAIWGYVDPYSPSYPSSASWEYVDPYAHSSSRHLIPGTTSLNGGQTAIDPYDPRSLTGRHSYQPLHPSHPSSNGFLVSSDVRSLSSNHSPVAMDSHIRSTMPYQAIQSRGMTSADTIGVGHYGVPGATVIASQTFSHVPLEGSLAYQSSTSAASMAVPSLMEERSRSKSSITSTPASQGLGSQTEPSTQSSIHAMDPALAERDPGPLSYKPHLEKGDTMYHTTQADHQSRHPPKQPIPHPVYSQLEPILAAPPSKAAQIEHLVFHVSPLSQLEEWDFAFYLACCWDGNPAMLRSTCALYQQWISAGLQRTEDLVNYFLYSQKSIMTNIQHFRKSRPGRMSFNPANRRCDNCFGTSPTLVPPSKEKPPQKQIRLCKDCGNAMVTFQDEGNYFHMYTLERRKLVAFHVEGIYRAFREMGYSIDGGERPSS